MMLNRCSGAAVIFARRGTLQDDDDKPEYIRGTLAINAETIS